MPQTDQPFTFDEFKTIYSQVPRLCVDLVIRDTEGMLLSLRKIPPHQGQWHLPGGTVFFKEPIYDSVMRIAEDELGVEIRKSKFLGYIEFLHQDDYDGFDHPISLVFLCTPRAANYRTNNQAEEIKFFKTLPDKMVKEHKDFLEKLD